MKTAKNWTERGVTGVPMLHWLIYIQYKRSVYVTRNIEELTIEFKSNNRFLKLKFINLKIK